MNKRSLSHRTHTTSSLSLSAHHHKLSLSLSLSVASRATTPSLWLFFFSLKLQANDHGYLANQTTVKKPRSYLFPATIILVLLTPSSVAQLSPSEGRILFQVQKLLEYPQALQGWNRWTNLCFLPSSPSLKIVCSNGHVTELTIIGIICCIYFSYTN
ncbi:putative LRR receptor-like serine/threonine-protein kinase [Glycine max]|nr:putative LRR receptor-like serine/threonine-protein kinase [Glycine max]